MSETPPQSIIDVAISAAVCSPCAKSKRGVVLFSYVKPDALFSSTNGQVVTLGWNRPPAGFACDGSAACREHCNKLCIHAEADALANIINEPERRGWIDLLHVKVVDDKAVPSGPPSCWQCSRAIAEANEIAGVWLLHEDGWRRYTTDEFHEKTLQHHDLPVIRKEK